MSVGARGGGSTLTTGVVTSASLTSTVGGASDGAWGGGVVRTLGRSGNGIGGTEIWWVVLAPSIPTGVTPVEEIVCGTASVPGIAIVATIGGASRGGGTGSAGNSMSRAWELV